MSVGRAGPYHPVCSPMGGETQLPWWDDVWGPLTLVNQPRRQKFIFPLDRSIHVKHVPRRNWRTALLWKIWSKFSEHFWELGLKAAIMWNPISIYNILISYSLGLSHCPVLPQFIFGITEAFRHKIDRLVVLVLVGLNSCSIRVEVPHLWLVWQGVLWTWQKKSSMKLRGLERTCRVGKGGEQIEESHCAEAQGVFIYWV